ncbi:MAG TPA: glucoamylase family protein [Desulfitobacteriaceae bacterium]|nr:glucoamylase family protein [Desulfitobacteriaceae bacterium]
MNFIESVDLSNPLRDIGLNREDLLEHALEIAHYHAQSGVWNIKKKLLPRTNQNMEYLKAAYQQITAYVQNTGDMVPAAEWFLDNYYILKDIRAELKKSLPRKYQKELPHLAGGNYQGYPRVYALMIEFVEHTDSQLQGDALKEFINTYQSQIPLSSGELWAIPTMLRIVLLENIRRLAEQIVFTQNERRAAEKWLEPFFKSEKGPKHWEKILEKMSAPPALSTTYAEILLRRIRDLGVEGKPILCWLDKVVAKQDTTVEDLAKLEHQRQAMYQVTMAHAITSLRFLSDEDWPHFYEEISLVEKMLESDPSEVFTKMDFNSRDIYRHHIEKYARRFRITELIVAKVVLRLARRAEKDNDLQKTHIGYYLIGPGRDSLEIELEKDWGGFRQSWGNLKRILKRHPQAIYFNAIVLNCLILFYVLLANIDQRWNLSPGYKLLVFLAIVFPVGGMVINLLNWLFTSILNPTFLPKLELSKGIPKNYRTMVVVPTLLPNVPRVRELIEQLEVYYLANQSPNLHFALLGDFTDADSPVMSADEEIVLAATQGIESLNRKYGDGIFYFFHRHRLWNPAEGVWMGWERKRGKIIEFNRLLRQSGQTSYSIKIGDLSVLNSVRYVITLDADTQLPRGTAQKLIGTIAHILHIPRLNDDKSRVIEGYGIIQPRINVSILSAAGSYFSRISSGKVGVDPYTCAVSDIYQDLFGEGIFTGKGIYDVDVFHQVTGDVFPENAILSHDLLEGLYARAGLATDIELVDGYPQKYHAFARRLHRWIRGDWQIFFWLFKELPLISKWKIFDNLRRSIEAPAQLLLIVLAFTILPGNPWFWVNIVILEVFFRTILCIMTDIVSEDANNIVLAENIRESLIQALLKFVFIPFQAYIAIDAIIRSLHRQLFTHKHLLEWETADAAERRLDLSLKTFWKHMWPAIAFVSSFAALGIFYFPGKISGFFPIAILWFSSPWIAYKISLPLKEGTEELSAQEETEARSWARRIWAFFEVYLNREDNWLPPDNVQFDPPKGEAHRTSPTNIGLALLANLSARNIGFLSLSETLARVDRTLGTLEQLEHWKGHFYNWYDTYTLNALHPLYVSTVDSGNLVVYLITLKSGLNDIMNKPVLNLKIARGLLDTYDLILNEWEGEPEGDLVAFGQELNRINEGPDFDLKAWHELLKAFPGINIKSLSEEAAFWYSRLREMVYLYLEELEKICPWLEYSEDQEDYYGCQFNDLLLNSDSGFTLQQLTEYYTQILNNNPAVSTAMEIKHAIGNINNLQILAENLQERLNNIIMSTDFRPLYDKDRQIFSIGYRLAEGVLDKSYYDLLASEARQASFIAIAKGDIPHSHWFKLGRTLTKVLSKRSLVSWSGTMFEFLMPLLVMRNYSGTLLDETYKSVISIQRRYGLKKKVPWGISESGYYDFDAHLNYQYKAFGVPGLGLKRGLIQDLVISPYSTYLACLVTKHQALKNIREMIKSGYGGRYGLFEAIDYTVERIPSDQPFRVIKSLMAHHQGMSFLALNNVLSNNFLQLCFHANPMVQATELLLQERAPVITSIVPQTGEQIITREGGYPLADDGKRFVSLFSADSLIPITNFISNGQYSVMVTNAGSGYSRCKNINITRWREDVTRDPWGIYFYIQNLNSGSVWSAAHQPCGDSGEAYKVTYAPDKIEFCRKDGNIATRMEIVVSPEDQVEIRRISLTNHSLYDRTIEITSYCEVVLAGANEDLAHSAFENLFVETEFHHKTLLAAKRPRGENKPRLWLMHTVVTEGQEIGCLQYETDRAKFIGRGCTLAEPHALKLSQPLSNTVGAVLDPIMSLRQRVLIKSGQTARVSFAFGIAENREEIIHIAEKYRDPIAVNRTFELAWTHSQMELRHLNLTPALANEAMGLAGNLLYLSPCRRDYAKCLEQNYKGQSALWPYAISGDLPIVLVRVQNLQHLDLVRQLLVIHEYWRLKGISADLVILNEDESGYVRVLQDTLRDLVSMGYARELINRSGGVFLLQKELVPAENISLLCSVARVVFSGEEGSCSIQFRKRSQALILNPESSRETETKSENRLISEPKRKKISSKIIDGILNKNTSLVFPNGLGGFAEDSGEYVIELNEGINTPLPWINVIANPGFGFQVSESGSGYTWSLNSRENKLTPWNNDPVKDSPGEILYLRDESTNHVWSPTPLPIRETEKYVIRHGQGYSVFRHLSHGINQELLMFVPLHKPLKITRLKLQNLTKRKREISVIQYIEWVLGEARERTAPYIVTEFDKTNNVLTARNVFQEEFSNRIAFLSIAEGPVLSYTGDRKEFIGRNGNLEYPAALYTQSLSENAGAGLDPCGALQVSVTLEANEEKYVTFFLGEAGNHEEALSLLREFKVPEKIDTTLQEVKNFWDNILNKLKVHTPEKSMDILLNRWLLYQTIVCRLWARSAFYQSGGAYGFRDQLQDVMPLGIIAPEIAREQIIRHCARQFVEGDVQHWWHTEKGKGIRTKFSDDLLWLPYVLADYVEHTADLSILDEEVHFLEDDLLPDDVYERYSIPKISREKGTVYEHCLRALKHGLRFGERGLPLIGSGDWNDGFSNIGLQGKGESVWLGWFIISTLKRFINICRLRHDNESADYCLQIINDLERDIELNGWDGGWYRRAYFDDGTPLGSVHNAECQIDSLVQSWAVLSGSARPSRAKDAMLALEHYLWQKEEGILLLLTPPFNHDYLEPGYIKGYVPGVRENGGQYTHSAIWVMLAFIKMGEADKAIELFHMLNPINHTRTKSEVAHYKVEPYVMAADVYANNPHAGRGGWTWYTGAAGWMYQAGIESILGFNLSGNKLVFEPCIPKNWPGYRIEYRYKSTQYTFNIRNPQRKMTGVKKIVYDEKISEDKIIFLEDDGKEHFVEVIM